MTTNVDSPAGGAAPPPPPPPPQPGGAPAQRHPGPDLLPFGWEPAPGDDHPDDLRAVFRFPTADDPHPGTARVLGMAVYGALLGLGGVGVGLRAFVSSLGGVPWWYVPTLSLVGLVGVGLAIAAYLSVHRKGLSWALLLAAGIPLLGDILLAAAY
jgi:hypothetical protein